MMRTFGLAVTLGFVAFVAWLGWNANPDPDVTAGEIAYADWQLYGSVGTFIVLGLAMVFRTPDRRLVIPAVGVPAGYTLGWLATSQFMDLAFAARIQTAGLMFGSSVVVFLFEGVLLVLALRLLAALRSRQNDTES